MEREILYNAQFFRSSNPVRHCWWCETDMLSDFTIRPPGILDQQLQDLEVGFI